MNSIKILAIGDFHGKITNKLKNKLRKLDFDIILSPGDLANTNKLRDLTFQNWDKLGDKQLKDIIPKKQFDKIQIASIKSMQPVIEFLYRLNKPVYLVSGNGDFTREEVRGYSIKSLEESIKNMKIILLKQKQIILKQYTLIGFSGYRGATAKNYRKLSKKKILRIKKENYNWDCRLKSLFSKKIDYKSTIFLCHDTPKNCLDIITNKKSPMYGKNLGDEYFSKYIKKYQPLIVVCGHMHENQGKCKIGKTTVVNPGAAYEGKAALIELKNEKVKNIKFLI